MEKTPLPQLVNMIGIYKTDKTGNNWAYGLGDVVARPDFLEAIILDLVGAWYTWRALRLVGRCVGYLRSSFWTKTAGQSDPNLNHLTGGATKLTNHHFRWSL